MQQLGFGRDAVRLMSSFDRPNIYYRVRYVDALPHEVRLWFLAYLTRHTLIVCV